MHPRWLDWAQRLQAIAQNGLTFAKDPFDIERYQQVREVAAEMLAAGSDANIELIRTLMAQEVGYATPKVDCRAGVFRDEMILLVREKLDAGRWTLPGGWVDIGEPPSLAIEREVWEEAGYRVKARKLVALYDRNKHPHPPYIYHAYKLFFHCELLDETQHLLPNAETEETGWFTEAEIPDLNLSTGRVTVAQIQRLFEHSRHPALPTEFD